VRKWAAEPRSVQLLLCDLMFPNEPAKRLVFSFRGDAGQGDIQFESETARPTSNSVFLPAKEILSLHELILRSREEYKLFGFDDTYFDLAKALEWQPHTKRFHKGLEGPMTELEDRLGGRVERRYLSKPDEIPEQRWRFRWGEYELPIGMAAEGAKKKIGIPDTLFRNERLSGGSIIFIDEPEAALHPEAVAGFLDVIATLVQLFQRDIQFFLASHSYFVIKKLYLLAQERELSVPVAMVGEKGGETADLSDDMPSNAIVDEAVRLYKADVELALK